jgi:hypothetical protein
MVENNFKFDDAPPFIYPCPSSRLLRTHAVLKWKQLYGKAVTLGWSFEQLHSVRESSYPYLS